MDFKRKDFVPLLAKKMEGRMKPTTEKSAPRWSTLPYEYGFRSHGLHGTFQVPCKLHSVLLKPVALG